MRGRLSIEHLVRLIHRLELLRLTLASLMVFLRLLFLSVKYKCTPGSIPVIHMLEALVINSQFEQFTMLDNNEHMVAYLEGILE